MDATVFKGWEPIWRVETKTVPYGLPEALGKPAEARYCALLGAALIVMDGVPEVIRVKVTCSFSALYRFMASSTALT